MVTLLLAHQEQEPDSCWATRTVNLAGQHRQGAQGHRGDDLSEVLKNFSAWSLERNDVSSAFVVSQEAFLISAPRAVSAPRSASRHCFEVLAIPSS